VSEGQERGKERVDDVDKCDLMNAVEIGRECTQRFGFICDMHS
jgi:hypothetical protein